MKIFRRVGLLAALLLALTAAALAADFSAADAPAFYAALEENLKAQNEDFSIAYAGDISQLGVANRTALGPMLRTMSARSPDGDDNADYLALNVEEGRVSWHNDVCTFHIEYLATQNELDEVRRRAEEIVASIALTDESDFTKIKLLYEYIGTHYVYDDTLTKFSAYDGLTTGSMVCQGYALLTWHVMWDAGIPCRIVTGTSSRENHAWNIVQLDGKWYNLDITWDSADEIGGIMSWQYFLKSPNDFTGHTRFGPYITEEYEAAHPMTAESAELSRVTLQVNDGAVSQLIIRAGIEVQLEAILPEALAGAQVQWVSQDPELVRVTEDGRLTATSVGNTLITASVVGHRGVISAQLPTQTVDLRTVSAWASAGVTDYYLAQLLPSSLCSDFQTGVTRAELARLCAQYVRQQVGWGSMMLSNPFNDLEDCPDWMDILRCQAVGIMKGTSASTFSPDAVVTRQEAAVVLMRLVRYLQGEIPEDPAELSYADAAQIAAWATQEVREASAMRLLRGSEGSFHPLDPMTREQMVLCLHRVYTMFPQEAEDKAA